MKLRASVPDETDSAMFSENLSVQPQDNNSGWNTSKTKSDNKFNKRVKDKLKALRSGKKKQTEKLSIEKQQRDKIIIPLQTINMLKRVQKEFDLLYTEKSKCGKYLSTSSIEGCDIKLGKFYCPASYEVIKQILTDCIDSQDVMQSMLDSKSKIPYVFEFKNDLVTIKCQICDNFHIRFNQSTQICFKY